MEAIEIKRFINSDDQRIYDNIFYIFSNYIHRTHAIKHLQILHNAIEKGFLLMYFGMGGVLFKVIGVPKLLKITYNDKEANLYRSIKEKESILNGEDMPFYQVPLKHDFEGRGSELVNSITLAATVDPIAGQLVAAMSDPLNNIFSVVSVPLSTEFILSCFGENLIKHQILEELEKPQKDDPEPKYTIICMPFLGFDLLSYLLTFSYDHFNQTWISVDQQKGHSDMTIPQFVILCNSLGLFGTKLKNMNLNGMYHRDIKPNNIMYDERSDDPSKKLTLIDFDNSIFDTPTTLSGETSVRKAIEQEGRGEDRLRTIKHSEDLSTFINLVVIPVMCYGVRNKTIYDYLIRTKLLFYIEAFSINVKRDDKNGFDKLMKELQEMTVEKICTEGASAENQQEPHKAIDTPEYVPNKFFNRRFRVDERSRILVIIKDIFPDLEKTKLIAYFDRRAMTGQHTDDIIDFLFPPPPDAAGGGIKRKNKISKKYRKLNKRCIRKTNKRLTK